MEINLTFRKIYNRETDRPGVDFQSCEERKFKKKSKKLNQKNQGNPEIKKNTD